MGERLAIVLSIVFLHSSPIREHSARVLMASALIFLTTGMYNGDMPSPTSSLYSSKYSFNTLSNAKLLTPLLNLLQTSSFIFISVLLSASETFVKALHSHTKCCSVVSSLGCATNLAR